MSFSRRYTRLVMRFPRRVVVTILVAGVAAFGVGVPIFHILVPNRTDFDDAGAQAGHVERTLRQTTGTDIPGGVIVLVHSRGASMTSPLERRRLARIAATVRRDPAVAQVRSALDAGGAAMVSRDRRSAYVTATLRSLPAKRVQDAVRRIRAALAHTRQTQLGGTDVANEEVGRQTEHDLVTAELFAFPVLLVLALLIFRGVVAALLPLAVGALAIAFTLAAMRAVNDLHTLSNFGLNLVTALSLGLGIDYSLFIVSRFREELTAGADTSEAVARTIATAGRTVLISSATVGAALASLLVFPQPFLSSMGICGLLVALTAAAVALTVLPAALYALGPRIDALSLPRWRRATRREVRAERQGPWYRLASTVQRRPVPVALVATAVLLALAVPSLSVRFIPFGSTMLPQSASARHVDDTLRRDYPAAGSPIVVIARPKQGAAALEPLTRRLTRTPGVAGVQAPRTLGSGRFELLLGGRHPDGTAAARATISRVRRAGGGVPLQVGGVTASALDKVHSLGQRLPLALGLLSATTFLLLFLLTRSILLPAKALVINFVTIAAVFGALVLVFQEGHGHALLGFTTSGGLEATQPVLLVAIAFGLSTDYGIFLLARVTEAHRTGKHAREAASTGLQQTGRIVTAAAALFCVATGALLSSPLVFVKLLGVGIPLAVILDATIARALLVPSLIALLGRWNWYAPRLLVRLHEQLPVGDPGGVERSTTSTEGDPGHPHHEYATDKGEGTMRRFALLTSECAQLGPALTEIIERHHDELALVVTSQVSGGKRPNRLQQTWENYRRSGVAFVMYLVYTFLLYFAYISADRVRSRVTRAPRRRLSVAELCERHGIPHIETDDVNNDAVVTALHEADLDHVVIYWFDQIIRDAVIRSAAKGVINVHAAFLPQCRGLFPVFWSALRGGGELGITAHEIVDEQIDAGPILEQVRVHVPRDASVLYWDYCVNRAGVEMLDAVLDDYESHHENRRDQQGGSYFSFPRRSDIREARRRGIKLATARDFAAICRMPRDRAQPGIIKAWRDADRAKRLVEHLG